MEEPVLFRREEVGMVKFDIRYMLLLRSVRPLRLYAYRVFWLRFANRCRAVASHRDHIWICMHVWGSVNKGAGGCVDI